MRIPGNNGDSDPLPEDDTAEDPEVPVNNRG